jgi:hypothetical protein
MNKKNKPARRKSQPARTRKTKPIQQRLRALSRFAARVPWIALTLCAAAFVALVAVEMSVAGVIHRMASDPITGVIFVSSAVLASLGVVFGPMVARSIRSPTQRALAWKIVWFCFALSVWNLSTTLANAQSQMTADAVRSAPTFESDQARLVNLNRQIDALADETMNPSAEAAMMNFIAERDLLNERLDGANPRPVMFAWENGGLLFWAKAGLFHILVAGFTAAFSMPMRAKRAPARPGRKAQSRSVITEDNVIAAHF